MAHLANLDKAFALATRVSEDARYTRATRKLFRVIAREIWLSLGEERPTEAVLRAAKQDKASAV